MHVGSSAIEAWCSPQIRDQPEGLTSIADVPCRVKCPYCALVIVGREFGPNSGAPLWDITSDLMRSCIGRMSWAHRAAPSAGLLGRGRSGVNYRG